MISASIMTNNCDDGNDDGGGDNDDCRGDNDDGRKDDDCDRGNGDATTSMSLSTV